MSSAPCNAWLTLKVVAGWYVNQALSVQHVFVNFLLSAQPYSMNWGSIKMLQKLAIKSGIVSITLRYFCSACATSSTSWPGLPKSASASSTSTTAWPTRFPGIRVATTFPAFPMTSSKKWRENLNRRTRCRTPGRSFRSRWSLIRWFFVHSSERSRTSSFMVD